MVGTPEHMVTRCSVIASMYPVAVKPGSSTTVPPLTNASLDDIEAFLWYSGADTSITSPGIAAPYSVTVKVMLRWVSSTPLGRPVEPEV